MSTFFCLKVSSIGMSNIPSFQIKTTSIFQIAYCTLRCFETLAVYARFYLFLQRCSPVMSAALFSGLTCAKYSSEMRPAHSIHCSMGLHGLEMSAHFINIRLIRIRFSGDVRTVLIDSPSPLFCNIRELKAIH